MELTQAMSSVKTELQMQADKAVAVAMGALNKLKSTLGQIPTSVQKSIGTLCKPLANVGAGVEKQCSSGATGILKNATGVVGKICKAGVSAMVCAHPLRRLYRLHRSH